LLRALLSFHSAFRAGRCIVLRLQSDSKSGLKRMANAPRFAHRADITTGFIGRKSGSSGQTAARSQINCDMRFFPSFHARLCPLSFSLFGPAILSGLKKSGFVSTGVESDFSVGLFFFFVVGMIFYRKPASTFSGICNHCGPARCLNGAAPFPHSAGRRCR